MVHHGSKGYDEAASAAAENAREKLGALIEKGRVRAGAVLEQVERQMPRDRVVAAPVIRFDVGDDNGRLGMALGGNVRAWIHDHALGQACERVGVPWKYAQELRNRGIWGGELAAHNLNELLEHQPGARYLLRAIEVENGDEEVRGFLSDRYRRLDSRPIVEAFGTAAAKVGAVPVEGYALETKIAIKALLPRVFEPVPNEVMAFGVMLSNSDFGDGALSLRCFMLRLFCTNYAITDEALRQVHLGGALPSDVAFSDRTYRLDTQRSASMILDVVGGELAPERINAACDLVRRANEERIEGGAVGAFLKKHLGVGDADQVTEAFSSADVENLPPGQSTWRLSNAISWVAGNTKDEAKRLELMKVAALALPGLGRLHRN